MNRVETARQGRGARLLVINPNTNPAVTALVESSARAAAGARTELVVVNPPTGPFAIETPAERAAAICNVLDLVEARRNEHYDAYIFACFDDIAVHETRARVRVPVIDICEAGILAAIDSGEQFAIVTTFEAAVPVIEGFVARYGAMNCCSVRAAGLGVSETANLHTTAEARLSDAVRRAIEEDGATRILLGSGALAGRAEVLAARCGVPVVDGVAAAVTRAELLARLP